MTPTTPARPAAVRPRQRGAASRSAGQARASSLASRLLERKVVVVQSGARDAYQLALAFEEVGLLEALVTDLFWPADRAWARALARLLPRRLRSLLAQRSEPRLRSARVLQGLGMGLRTLVLDRLPQASADARRQQTRAGDAALGRRAGTLARRRSADLVSYSYYGFDAFTAFGPAGTLFQLHPHPATMRKLLTDELNAHPDCAASLLQEWELSLPEHDFDHLVGEITMADRFLVASSFTRSTLVEHGVAPERIRVVPYGVDLTRFRPDPGRPPTPGAPLQLLFVGRINQRKGIKYLLEALRLLGPGQVELTVCGRVVDSLDLFTPFGDQVRIRPSVSAADLVAAYQTADLFVFPSVAEGFGQVLLESLASGLPVLSTNRTAAPDLISDGREGFIVAPQSAVAVATSIDWALTHRAELARMRIAARERAEHFTWQRFRSGIIDAMRSFEPSPPPSVERENVPQMPRGASHG